MALWRRAFDVSRVEQANTIQRRRSAIIIPVLVLSSLVQPLQSAVLSEKIDAEIAELHAFMDDGFNRISNLTAQLQTAGAIGAKGPLVGNAGPALGPKLTASPASVAASSGGVPNGLSPDKIASVRKLEADFASLQQQAFQIGRESQDNAALARHPQVHNYVQSLRELRPRVNDMISDLEKELLRITGKQIEKPKKQRKAVKKIKGLSEKDITVNAKSTVERDSRDFRTKAMDYVSTFRERQMQMQDKQRDLQREMDGPDWPKEDWPLSSTDAKVVGDGEAMIGSTQQELVKKMEPFGGLPRVHESGDESVLEQIVALSMMMSGYCELIEQYVETVKKANRNKKKTKKAKGTKDIPRASDLGATAQLPPLHVNSPPLGSSSMDSGSLRDNLLNFGRQHEKPFAWLGGGGVAPTGDPSLSNHQPSTEPTMSSSFSQFGSGVDNPGVHRQQGDFASSSAAFARFANLGSSLGNLAGGFAKDTAGMNLGSGSFGAQHLPPRPRQWSGASGEL